MSHVQAQSRPDYETCMLTSPGIGTCRIPVSARARTLDRAWGRPAAPHLWGKGA